MSDLALKHNTLNSDNPILTRTSHDLGISQIGLIGSLGGDNYRIFLSVTIPKKQKIHVKFPKHSFIQ